jgi:hypothetical membrane protein
VLVGIAVTPHISIWFVIDSNLTSDTGNPDEIFNGFLELEQLLHLILKPEIVADDGERASIFTKKDF